MGRLVIGLSLLVYSLPLIYGQWMGADYWNDRYGAEGIAYTGRLDDLGASSQALNTIYNSPLDTRRCCYVESTSMTLIQGRNNVACPVGNVVT